MARVHKKTILISSVLASTWFVTPLIHAYQITDTRNTTQTTDTDGTVEVLPSGQVSTTNQPAIVSNAIVGSTVIIDPGNINQSNAVLASNDYGISLNSGSLNGALVQIGARSGVRNDDLNNAIYAGIPGTTIINAGTVRSDDTNEFAPIFFQNNDGYLNNHVSGLIRGSGNDAYGVYIDGANFSADNHGQIRSALYAPIIFASGSYTEITNHTGGFVRQEASNVIVDLNGNGGVFTNEIGGFLLADSGTSNYGVSVTAQLGKFVNAGVIESGLDGLYIQASISDTVNTGTITSFDGGSAIKTSTGTTITNTGNLNGIPDAILIQGGTVLNQNGGTINGDITLNAVTDFTVNGGYIGGNIHQNQNNNSIFLNSGILAQSVNVNGTTSLFLKNDAFVNKINTGTDSVGIQVTGGDFNRIYTDTPSPGQVVYFRDDVNIFGTIDGLSSVIFQPGSTNSSPQFTLNGPIVNIQGVIVDPDTTVTARNLISRSSANGVISVLGRMIADGVPVIDLFSGISNLDVSNGGILELNTQTKLTIWGDSTNRFFVVRDDSSLVVNIEGYLGGEVSYGHIEYESVDPSSGFVRLEGMLKPQFRGFIPNNTVMDVILVNNGNVQVNPFIDDQSTLVQPTSLTVYFSKDVVDLPFIGEVLRLTSHRNAYSAFANPMTSGVAGVLDVFAQGNGPTNNDFFTLLSQLDQVGTIGGLNDSLYSLTPPANYGLVQGSHIGMDSVFEGITDRVWDVAWHHRDHGRRHSEKPTHIKRGKNSGDMVDYAGVWLRPIGAYVDQSERDFVAGYKAKAVGGVLGGDWGLTDCTTVGVAISYTHVNVDDKAFAPKDQSIKSWMGTLYGSFDFRHGVFMDAMISGAANDYKINRVISLGNSFTAAQASFDGTQWGLQGDLGIALSEEKYFAAPFVRLKYIHLNLDDYSEAGASALNLNVKNHTTDEFMGGFGLRLSNDYIAEGIEWVPELTAMIAYDFVNDGEASVANFSGGGPAFTTNGMIPGRMIFDAGLAVNAMIDDNSVITAKYNIELREQFVGNTAYLQYFYGWG